MQVPTEWRIMGRTFETERLGRHDADLGCYHRETSVIGIAESLDDDPTHCLEIMLHEVLHALWDAASLPAECDEERAVSALSRGMLAVLRDNPAFVGCINAVCEAS